MKIITIASLKGGSGKTSLALFCYQQMGNSIIVDSDPNNNTTDFMLRHVDTPELDRRNLIHLFTDNTPAQELIYTSEIGGTQASVIPCTVNMHQVGSVMNGNPGALLTFGPRLRRLDYDYCILDTPPSLTFEFRAGLYAADAVVTPINFSRWTMYAIKMLGNELAHVEETTGKRPKLIAVPANVSQSEDARLRSLGIEDALGCVLSPVTIYRSATVRNAANHGNFLKQSTTAYDSYTQLTAYLKEAVR